MRFRFFLSPRLIPFLCFFLTSCSSAPTPTPFIPPTNPPPLIEPTFIINPAKQTPEIQPSPLPTIPPTPSSTATECVNDLSFLADLTIPDDTFITYGSIIDKQWLVLNSGTCNWDSRYRLKHIGGAILGAPEEIALYPAKAGTQATIRILFTAPFEEGVYESAWQAFDPGGQPFGDPIYIRVLVSP
ncbi:MAG TPA: NBR1-Ig-like domain-containing protein [Anaerolineales bacterium]|nr:NBR1-Ig-like domain-containing protein [Anaerolineales bacterium]